MEASRKGQAGVAMAWIPLFQSPLLDWGSTVTAMSDAEAAHTWAKRKPLSAIA